MTWSWSHTETAYQAVKTNIENMPRNRLKMIYAEWNAKEGENDLNDAKYTEALDAAEGLRNEQLAEFIWEKTNAQRLCTNGGWEAYCCPFGCIAHTVPFDEEEAL